MTEERELLWKRLENEVNEKGGNGAEFVDAMKEFYTIYCEDVIEWYASLYDYKNGGFYFTPSARDNDGFLPDAEATAHNMVFFECFDGVGDFIEAVPAWMKEQTGRWLKGLQDPNGYIYHPQWTHEMIDGLLARKGRDLAYGLMIMQECGFRPTYDTPTGEKGDGLLPDGTPVCAAEEKTDSAPTPAPAAEPEFSPHLKSAETFRQYLHDSEEKLKTAAYAMGNELSNQVGQIIARDRMLREAGETDSLCAMLIDWLNAAQNPETGTWYDYAPEKEGNITYHTYDCNNSLLKIISVYNTLGVGLPHPMEAARSAMRAVKSPLPPRMVCDLYNTWFAVGAVVENIQKHSSLPADERESYVKTIRAELLKDAPDCVRAMKGKLLPFRRPDHAFSYYADKQCMVSQGAPIAAKGYDEGDANASVIVFGGCNSLIYYALGLTRVKPFSRALLEKYLTLLEENHRKFG